MAVVHLGVSLIAKELNKMQIKPYTNGPWTSPSIRDMLINPVYIGKVRWNWRPAKKKMVNGEVVKSVAVLQIFYCVTVCTRQLLRKKLLSLHKI